MGPLSSPDSQQDMQRTKTDLAGIVPSRYTSLTSLRFTVQWIYRVDICQLRCSLVSFVRGYADAVQYAQEPTGFVFKHSLLYEFSCTFEISFEAQGI